MTRGCFQYIKDTKKKTKESIFLIEKVYIVRDKYQKCLKNIQNLPIPAKNNAFSSDFGIKPCRQLKETSMEAYRGRYSAVRFFI